MNKSYWQESYNIQISKKELPDEIDILIIGGGMAGLMTAYELSKNNLNIAIVTADRVGYQVSSKTTAKISIMHNLLYQNIIKIHGKEKAEKYYNSQKEAVQNMINIIETEKIECNLEKVDNYMYAETEDGMTELLKEYNVLKLLGSNVELIDDLPIGKKIKKAFKYKNEYIFNPVKYMNGIVDILLKRNISIYENYTAIDYKKEAKGYSIKFSDNKSIKAKYVVVTTHYPIFNMAGLYFGKLYQEKNYLVSFETKKDLRGIYINTDSPVRSLRYANDDKYVGIMVGNSHVSGKNVDYEKEFESLKNSVLEFDSNAIILNTWTNQDVMSIDYLPFIGRYSRFTPNMYVATAFQTWGMTTSHLAAKIISDIIQEKDNQYIDLYNPLRLSHFKSLNESFKMIGKSLNGLLISRIINKNKSFTNIKNQDGAMVKYKGKNYAVYNTGSEYIILTPNCPHVNCFLQWNKLEKTWDCKCHGSRFDIYGNVQEGPATLPLKRISLDKLL